MKKIIGLLITLISVVQINATQIESNYWVRISNFDNKGFQTEYEQLIEGDNLVLKGKTAYALYATGSRDESLLKDSVESISLAISKEGLDEKQVEELNYILAECYLNLIIDPATWMEYGEKYEEALGYCLDKDPANPLYKLNSALSMIMEIPNPRGSIEDGLELLAVLEAENSNNNKIIYEASKRKLDDGDIENAEFGFNKVIEINRNHILAIEKLNEINLTKQNLVISDIKIVNSTKTSSKRILKKVENFKGTIFNIESSRSINNLISEISTVSGTTIKGVQIDNENIDLELTITENNMQALMVLLGGPVGFDNKNELTGAPLPMLMYMDTNLFGTGIALSAITAGVYNELAFVKEGLINDGILDMELNLTSMLLSVENNTYSEGDKIDGTKKNSWFNAKIGLGKSHPLGLRAFVSYQSQWDIHENLKDRVKPNNVLTHTASGDFTLLMGGEDMLPLSGLNDGFKLSFQPEVSYKPNYKSWGDKDNLFTHNNSASWKFKTQLGYYKNVTDKNGISLDLSWLASSNVYQSDKYALGHAKPGEAEAISGYIPGELIFKNGLLSNLKYIFTGIPNQFEIYGKYDLLYHMDDKEFFNGATIGTSVYLPWEILLQGEVGVGFNSLRENDIPGFQIGITFVRMFML